MKLEQKHLLTVRSVMARYLKTHKINLSSIDFASSEVEVVHYTENGIRLLAKMLKVFPGAKVDFEYAFECSEERARGRVDCLFSCSQGFGIIDFKRSAGSIPSASEICSYRKIQLPFYLSHLNKINSTSPLFIGYINLGAIPHSRFISFSMFAHDHLLQLNELDKALSIAPEGVEQMLSQYQSLESLTLAKLGSDCEFASKPATVDVCRYCPIQAVCERER